MWVILSQPLTLSASAISFSHPDDGKSWGQYFKQSAWPPSWQKVIACAAEYHHQHNSLWKEIEVKQLPAKAAICIKEDAAHLALQALSHFLLLLLFLSLCHQTRDYVVQYLRSQYTIS